jgi:hypothetical protein
VGISFGLFIACLFVGLWITVSLVLALVGGWLGLARVYRTKKRFEGQLWRFQPGYMRFLASYGTLTVGADLNGLYLKTPILLSHPPLFIPWKDISVSAGKCMWVSVFIFSFSQVPSVRLQLKEGLGREIQMVAGSSWPGSSR